MEHGRAAALRALRLDARISEAHNAMGFVSLCYDWDMNAAERSFQRTIQLDPQNATAWQWYSFERLAANDQTRAIEFARRAVELDHDSSVTRAHLGWILYFARRHSEALKELGKAVPYDRALWRTHFNSGCCYLQLGQCRKAIDAMETAVALNDYTGTRLALACAYGHAGEHRKAGEVITSVLACGTYVSQYWLAIAYLGLGDSAAAMSAMQQAYANREWYLILLRSEPLFDSARQATPFAEIVARVGL
jgi:tetratricopeptide (TPR) repeat protein